MAMQILPTEAAKGEERKTNWIPCQSCWQIRL